MANYANGPYTISTDHKLLDVDIIQGYLSSSYWASGRTREIVEKSIANSLCFGVYHGDDQIGLARVVTDYATFAWICDVFILEPYRGKGLGKWLISVVVNSPELHEINRLILATRDAHGLYSQMGFVPLKNPERWMEKRKDQVYLDTRRQAV